MNVLNRIMNVPLMPLAMTNLVLGDALGILLVLELVKVVLISMNVM